MTPGDRARVDVDGDQLIGIGQRDQQAPSKQHRGDDVSVDCNLPLRHATRRGERADGFGRSNKEELAADDIAAFAALAFEQPDEYLGKTIEIAGDVLTPS